MISGQSVYAVRLREELATAPAQRAIQSLNSGIGTICDAFIEGRPQAFGGLEFGGAWREEHEMEAARQAEFGSAMPRRAIDDQDDFFVAAHTFGMRKRGQRDLHGRRVHGRQDQPARPTGSGVNKAIHIAPFVAVGTDGDGSVPPARPHPAHDRLQAAPGLIMRPDFDGRTGPRAPEGGHLSPELFLKARCCAGEAAWA